MVVPVAPHADVPQARAERRRAIGVWVLAAILATALVGFHFHYRHPDGRGFALASLPGFDAYVYAAMAEHPTVFTAAPWGYRVLVPTLAHAIQPARPLRALRWITLFSLVAAGLSLFAFLRRLGHSVPAGLLGIVIFCLSSPVGAALESPFTGDALAVAIEASTLAIVAAGAGLPAVLLLLALGLMTKDVLLLFVPLTYVPLRRVFARRIALGLTGLLGCGAIGLLYGLRLYWTPHLRTPHPTFDRALLDAFLADLHAAGVSPLGKALLAGLLPLAALGAFRRVARPFLARYGHLVAATVALPFFAWLNVPDTEVFGFFGDLPRLHLHALPLLIPLALTAVDRVWPNLHPPSEHDRTPAPRAWLRWALSGATALAVAFPFVSADLYRRHPLHGRREGLQVFLACRLSLRAAARLAEGGTVALPVKAAADEAADSAGRRRWYLMDGWDDESVFGTGEMVLRQTPSTLLVPCLAPRPIRVRATVRSLSAASVQATVNAQRLSPAVVRAGIHEVEWLLPASALFRGDNVLTLTNGGGGALLFEALSLSPTEAATTDR